MKKILSLATKSVVVLIAAYGVKLCKISVMAGSHTAFFSATSSMLPLTGAFGGIVGTALLFVVRTLMFPSKVLYNGQFLAFILPGVSASLYWSTDTIIVRLLLPIICMALFIAHPVGSSAFLYSLFWLIPVFLYFINKRSIVTDSLASTFIAHAVGSVIWLYTVPMQASDWIALIPFVCVERILFASGMVVMHYLFSYLFQMIKEKTPQKRNIACKYNV